jgi:hypothetical protein
MAASMITVFTVLTLLPHSDIYNLCNHNLYVVHVLSAEPFNPAQKTGAGLIAIDAAPQPQVSSVLNTASSILMWLFLIV